MNLIPAERRHLSRSIGSVLRSIIGATSSACDSSPRQNPHGSCGFFGTCGDPSHVLFSYFLPGMSIEDYILRMMTYMGCDDYVYRTATGFVKRLADHTSPVDENAGDVAKTSSASNDVVTPWSIHRIFLGAAIIASKVCDDEPRNMMLFANCGGVDLCEVCSIEVVVLGLLQYDVFVTSEQFREINKMIDVGFAVLSPGTPQRHHHGNRGADNHLSATPLSCSSFGALSGDDSDDEPDEDDDARIDVVCA